MTRPSARLYGNSPWILREDIHKPCRAKVRPVAETVTVAGCNGMRGIAFSAVHPAQDPRHMCEGAAAMPAYPDPVPEVCTRYPQDLECDTSAYACMTRHYTIHHHTIHRGNVKGGVRRSFVA